MVGALENESRFDTGSFNVSWENVVPVGASFTRELIFSLLEKNGIDTDQPVTHQDLQLVKTSLLELNQSELQTFAEAASQRLNYQVTVEGLQLAAERIIETWLNLVSQA